MRFVTLSVSLLLVGSGSIANARTDLTVGQLLARIKRAAPKSHEALQYDQYEVMRRLDWLQRQRLGFRPARADEARLVAALTDPAFDAPARDAVRSFLLALGHAATRARVRRQLVGRDWPAAHRAAIVLWRHVRDDVHPDWGLTLVVEQLVARRFEDAPAHALFEAAIEHAARGRRVEAKTLASLLSRYPDQEPVALGLGIVGGPDATRALMGALTRRTGPLAGRLRPGPVAALAAMRHKPIVPLLIADLDKAGSEARWPAVQALIALRDRAAEPALRRYLARLKAGAMIHSHVRIALAVVAEDVDAAVAGLIADPRVPLGDLEPVVERPGPGVVAALDRVVRSAERDTDERALAVLLLGKLKAVDALIGLLAVRLPTRPAGHTPFPRMIGGELRAITGQGFGDEAEAWKRWRARSK